LIALSASQSRQLGLCWRPNQVNSRASKLIDSIAYNKGVYVYAYILYWSSLKLESCCLIGPIKILSDPASCSSSGRPQNIGFDLLDASIQPSNHHHQAPISLVLLSEPCPVSLQSPLPSIQLMPIARMPCSTPKSTPSKPREHSTRLDPEELSSYDSIDWK